MTLLHRLAKRLLLGLSAAWVVLTAVFLLFTQTDDWVLQARRGLLKFSGASPEEVARSTREYLSARGLDRPLAVQYVDWMGNMLTLNWGESFASGEPVLGLVLDSSVRTGMYVLPALVLGIIIGVLVGLYAATNPESRLADTGLGTAYLLFALPNFWVGGLAVSLSVGGVLEDPTLLFDHVLPILLTTTVLLGGYVSYTRAHATEYVEADFVRLVEAKGVRSRTVARHILRNAAIPVFSMLFTEALALLVLSVFVIETLFGIDGFGRLLFDAINRRDLPVILGGSILIIAVGVLGNVVQDLSYSLLDPRVDSGSR